MREGITDMFEGGLTFAAAASSAEHGLYIPLESHRQSLFVRVIHLSAVDRNDPSRSHFQMLTMDVEGVERKFVIYPPNGTSSGRVELIERVDSRPAPSCARS